MESVSTWLPALEHMGSLLYWVAFFVALAESIAFVGLIIPGTVFVLLAGFAASHGTADLGDLIWFVALGAIVGDGFSYYWGTRGTKYFKPENKFLKLDHIEKGRQFFRDHGNKSVFLGRFIGPLRPIVPFIAGLARMPFRNFLFWNITSAFLWAITHLTLGYFFGYAFKLIEVWSFRGGVIIFTAVLLFFLVRFALRRGKALGESIRSFAFSVRESIAHNADLRALALRYPAVFSFLLRRVERTLFTGLPLTILMVSAGILFFFLIGIATDAALNDAITALDTAIMHFFADHRGAVLSQVFLSITFLGDEITLGVFAVVLIIYFLRNAKEYFRPFAVTFIGAEATILLAKEMVNRARPELAYYVEQSFSFPSGHSGASLALYGYIAYALMRSATTKRLRWVIGLVAVFAIGSIGMSRIYLGVHFFSDVIAGYLVGGLWLLGGIVLSELALQRRESIHRGAQK